MIQVPRKEEVREADVARESEGCKAVRQERTREECSRQNCVVGNSEVRRCCACSETKGRQV